jgi:hypothetical protein
MWCLTFEQRLAAWNALRDRVRTQPKPDALEEINTWWQKTPWRAYHLHWDDQTDWPDPWQLLSDNIYCDLARGLGILYTITVLDRDDLQDAVLVDSNQGNLVLVEGGKYILNWDQSLGLNINLQQNKHHIAQSYVKQQLY